MAVDRVLEPGEILLDGKFYRLQEGTKVKRTRTAYPAKRVDGDYTMESRPDVSVKVWQDFRGGQGLERELEGSPKDRYWWSNCRTHYKGHLTLGPLQTKTATSGENGLGAIGELGGTLYVAFGADVRSYTNSNDTWSAVLDTLPGSAISALTLVLGGTRYLVFGQASNFTYTSNGSAFTDVTKDSDYLAFWNDSLWGIDNTGQLWYTAAVATAPTNDAKVPLGEGSVTSLFVGPDATGEPILYAGTTEGLFAHDFANAKFWRTGISWPHVAGTGVSNSWQSNIYCAIGGLGMREYSPIQGTTRLMGPDRDDGIVSTIMDYAANIGAILPANRELIVLMSSENAVVVVSWDGYGWRQLGGQSGYRSPAIVSNAYSVYRLWGHEGDLPDERLIWTPLTAGRDDNPTQNTTLTFATTGAFDTAWFSITDPDVTATALDATVLTQGVGGTTPTTGETVRLAYRLNYSTGSFTNMGSLITCEAYKTTTMQFPNDTTPVGTDFKAIQFRLTFTRAATGSSPELKSPDVIALILAYRRKLSTKRRFTVMLDCAQTYKTRPPDDLLADLDTAVNSSTKVAFIYRDSAKGGTTYYVDARYLELQEETGRKEEGIVALELVEL